MTPGPLAAFEALIADYIALCGDGMTASTQPDVLTQAEAALTTLRAQAGDVVLLEQLFERQRTCTHEWVTYGIGETMCVKCRIPSQAQAGDTERLIDDVIQRVAELPDRTSPDEWRIKVAELEGQLATLTERMRTLREQPVPPTIATDDAFREPYTQGYRHALTDVLAVLADLPSRQVAIDDRGAETHSHPADIGKPVIASSGPIDAGARPAPDIAHCFMSGCEQCGALWRGGKQIRSPVEQHQIDPTTNRCRSTCYACERTGLRERIKFTADYETLAQQPSLADVLRVWEDWMSDQQQLPQDEVSVRAFSTADKARFRALLHARYHPTEGR